MTSPGSRGVYLDSAATTAVRREVLEAMWPYLTSEFGNPSSTHALGAAAASALADARARVARRLGARAADIVFTSGGTEADNLAIKGIALAAPRGRHIVTTAIEHPAVVESCAHLARVHGFEISTIGVDSHGVVDLAELEATLRDESTLVSVMLANNEIGTVQPIADVVRLARSRGVPVHTDAVQAVGSMPIDVGELGVDALALSGHKLGAPKGVGALWVRPRLPLEPLVHGGGQERDRRSGTENVAFAVALAAALDLTARNAAPDAAADRARELAALRDRFVRVVLEGVPGARLTGHPTDRLPGHASFVFPGTSGESVLLELERAGVISSSGSACAAGRDDPSHVLLAIGLDAEVAQTAVRFTFDEVSRDDLDAAARAVVQSVGAVRSLG